MLHSKLRHHQERLQKTSRSGPTSHISVPRNLLTLDWTSCPMTLYFQGLLRESGRWFTKQEKVFHLCKLSRLTSIKTRRRTRRRRLSFGPSQIMERSILVSIGYGCMVHHSSLIHR